MEPAKAGKYNGMVWVSIGVGAKQRTNLTPEEARHLAYLLLTLADEIDQPKGI